MKILFITQFLPYYPDTGGKIKTWEILKILSKKNKISLTCFVDKKENTLYEKELKKFCWEVKTFFQPIITKAYQSLKYKAFLSLFSLKPFRVYKHYSSEFVRYLQDVIGNNDFDAIYFDHDVMCQYLDFIPKKGKLLIFDQHNISSQASWRNFLIENNLIGKTAYFLETIKWFFYEKKYIKCFNKIFTISETDKRKLLKWSIAKNKIQFLPIPIKSKNLFEFDNKNKNILFVGLMSWKPNEDGFWWFYKKVYPRIKEKINNVTFTVIGDNPSKKISAQAENDSSLKILGYVKNIDHYYNQASVFVVPIRSGGGIRIKILKALAYGIPLVSTKIGAEGINILNGKEFLLADNSEDFVNSIIKLLNNPFLAKKLSKNGIKFIENNYNKQNAEKALRNL
jgi:glycosyltransferase involved in cell wall biosynthesis